MPASAAPTTRLFLARKLTDLAGATHVAFRSRHAGFGAVMWCSGRTVAWMAEVDAPGGATCRACQRKATANGLDTQSL